jgi:hypothetical protein
MTRLRRMTLPLRGSMTNDEVVARSAVIDAAARQGH